MAVYRPWAALVHQKSPETYDAEGVSSFADAITSGWERAEKAHENALRRQQLRRQIEAMDFKLASDRAQQEQELLTPEVGDVLRTYGQVGGGRQAGGRGGSGGRQASGGMGGGVGALEFAMAQEALHQDQLDKEAAGRAYADARRAEGEEYERQMLFGADPAVAIQAQEQANRAQEIYERNRAIQRQTSGQEYWNPETGQLQRSPVVSQVGLSPQPVGSPGPLTAVQGTVDPVIQGQLSQSELQAATEALMARQGRLRGDIEADSAARARAQRQPDIRHAGFRRDPRLQTTEGIDTGLDRAFLELSGKRRSAQQEVVEESKLDAARRMHMESGRAVPDNNVVGMALEARGFPTEIGGSRENAIAAFQREYGLDPDGSVGPATTKALLGELETSPFEGRSPSYMSERVPGRFDAVPGIDFPAVEFEAKRPGGVPAWETPREGDKGAAEMRATEALGRYQELPEGMRNPLTEALGLAPGVVMSPAQIGQTISMAKQGYPDALEKLAQMGVDPNELGGLSGSMMAFQLEAAKRANAYSDSGDTDLAMFNAYKSSFAAATADLEGISDEDRVALAGDLATIALKDRRLADKLLAQLPLRRSKRRQSEARIHQTVLT